MLIYVNFDVLNKLNKYLQFLILIIYMKTLDMTWFAWCKIGVIMSECALRRNAKPELA